MKQSTSFAQVATNLLNVLQGSSKTLRLLLVMFLTLTVSAEVWGADVVYKTAKFGSSYNSAKVSSYTSSWYSTYNGFRVDIVNANNNQNGWSYIKMGSKNAALTGTITTNAKIDAAITKVSLKIDAITASNITSITLKTATSSNGTYTHVGTFTKATGTQTVTLASPTANLFYKIEVVCKQGSSNGLIQISQVDYYKSDVVATPEYNITYVGDDHITYSGTKPETITKEDGGFELEFSVNDGYQLDDVQVKMGGQNLVVEDDYYWEEGYLLILPETDITGDIVITFVTVSTCTTSPTVSAGSNSNVTTTTATVSCSSGITSLGSAGCPIESYGFVYGTSSNPTISNTKVQVGTTYTTTGTAFSKELTGLTANTTYYVRPYATNGNGTAYGTQTSFKTSELPKYTVTLVPGSGSVTDTELEEESAGAGVKLPKPTLDCGDWEFAGWTTSSVANETSSKPATLLTGSYSPTSDITLYAVYQRTEETEGNGSETEVTKSVSISNYATANNWNNETKYTSVTIDENITATASTGTNTGKYYTSGTNWRFYQTEKATLTISAATGCTIKTVKVTYSVSKNGVLTYKGANVNSGSATTINATSATFGVGNTGGETNGQVRITAIEVIYTTITAGETITTTYYHSTPECGTPCTDAVNVTKGTPSNGSFTMVSGYQSTCNGPVTVTLSDIEPATGYQFSAITQTGINSGVTIDNTAKTVTYAQNTSGTSTINVTFTPAVYTITYKDQGDVAFSGTHEDGYPKKHTYNTATTLKSASKDHYTFDGWYKESNCSGTKVTTLGATEYTDNITLYAKWTANTYTITLDAGTGECGTESFTTTNASGVTLPTASHTCTDWSFAGWWTEEVSSTNTSPGTLMKAGDTYKPTSNITLYAVYSTEEAGDAFTGYAKVTTAPDDWSGKYLLSTGTYTATGNFDSDATSGHLVRTTYTPSNEEKADWEFTLTKVGNTGYSILFPDGNWYLGWKESTSFERSPTDPSQNAAYLWTPSTSGITNVYATTRKIADNGSADFRPYSTPSSGVVYLYKRIGGGTTTIYNSNPSCEVCENILSINKGEETNGNTFTLSQSGNVETCDGDVEVVVTPTPAEHYSVSSVTATAPTTGGAPTVTDNGNGTWTVTYNQNSTGESTINVTFVQNAKASITFSELGVTTTDNTTYYVGETYTLPSTSSQSCEGKQLVGWSRVEVAETDTKPTENYFELGAEVTLAETQTFYAVFATEGEGGGGEYTLVTSANDFTDGVYVIAALDNGTYYFIDGQYTGDGIGVESTGLPVSKMSNNSFTELPSNAVEIEIEDDEEPDGENHYYFISYYDETNSKWKFLDDNGTNKTLKWVEWDDGLAVYTYHPVFDTKTYLLSGSGAAISQNGSAKTSFIRNYANGTTYNSLYFFKKTGSSTSYTAYTTSCIPTYSITYDFAGGTGSHCSNTSVPQGNTYTICDDAPTREGYTFQGWSDGTSTYAAGTTITPTSDVTLTAIWQINTYTVTWSNNGVTTPVTYEHGDDLTLPSAPASCDGVKEFVGWTADNTFTYHATTPPSDLFTEKTTTVTANATYYAVFATQGEGSANFVLGESGTFKMYANVNGTNYYAQGGVSNSKITSTTEAANASDYTLTHKGSNQYTIQLGNAYIGHSGTSSTELNTTETTWTIKEGVNGSWRIVSPVNTSRALAYRASTYKIFKAYSMTSVEAGDTEYYDIEFGGISSGYSDYTTTCQQIESIEVQNPQTEFYLTDDFTIGSGKVIATLSGGGTTDVTALATFSGYNMEVVGTYTVTVTYMGATATYNINVKALDNAWVLTWNVSGKTNTGLGPRYVTKETAIGPLPTPEVPAACEGKTFMGWTESNIVPSDGVGIEYITEETKPSDNTTYYAVFATVNNFCTQKPLNEITNNSKVVIVAVASLTDDGGAGKAISSRATDDTYNLQGDDVAIYDQTINTPHSTCIWTITKSGEKYIFTQDGKYLNGIIDGSYSNLKYNNTSDSWSLSNAASGMAMTYNMKSTNASTEYVEWYNGKFTIHNEVNTNGAFDMQFFVTANADGNADITDYTTGCTEYTITYYGFRGGYSTSTSSDGTIVLPVNSMHTVPNCGDVVKDHTNLGREFLDVWMTQPHGGHTFKPGDTFILTQDTTLYAQWKMETTSDVTTLPIDIEDLAGTDVYVYGGKTLNIQPGTTTINSLTLKGGLQSDGSYKMPIVWVPEGATLVRNSNKIYLDLVVNAKNYYPFAVPFATKNDQYIDYLAPDLNAASTYGDHFVIKTYDGERRAIQGEDRANNWVKVKRHQSAEKPSYLQPGVGYIITALTRSDKDTATIRIPMTVPNTWFENGEQAVVGTTVRNTIAVTAHAGAAATEHQRHAGWNFVANPYLSNFTGGGIDATNGLDYIDGELIIQGGYEYSDETVPYVTIPAYDFSYYTQHKLSDVKLSPEWSFFVQIGTSGTMDFSTAGRQETPASIAARHDAAQSFKMDVDITLTDGNHSDQTGIIINDRYSDAYEIGRDLEKMFGSAYNLVVYSLMSDNTPLAYQALAELNHMQTIPIGYRAPQAGEYTFSLNQSTSSIDLLNEQYDQLILVDYETGALTNLLNSSYTFDSERTQSTSRFALYAIPRQNTPTDVPNFDSGDNNSTRKILHNGHLYILRDGKVYNGNGQIVKQ